MSQTWFNWKVVNQTEAIGYIFNMILMLFIIGLFVRPTPFGILIFTLFNDFIFYKFRHQKFIDSDHK